MIFVPLSLDRFGSMHSMPVSLPKSRMGFLSWKPLILLLGLAIAMAVVYVTPIRGALGNVERVKSWLHSLGWMGPVVWMGIVFPLVAAGMPRLLFCPIGGLAFGFWYGLLWTQLSTLAGYYALFLFVRWGGQGFVLRHWPRMARLKDHLQGHSAAMMVFAVRQLPISGLLINFLLGLSPLRHRHFLLGTALGILPEAVPFTLVGSGLFEWTRRSTPFYTLAGIGLFFLISASVWYFTRHSRLLAELREKTTEAPLCPGEDHERI